MKPPILILSLFVWGPLRTQGSYSISAHLPADDVRCCLFCDAAVPLRIMLGHVARHIAKGDAMVDARHRCRSTGTCETMLNGTKVCTNCPYRYSFKYKKALEKKRNVPRKCLVPMCPASPFTLNIKCHL